MKKLLLLFLFFFLFDLSAAKALLPQDYAKYFEIDLDKSLPTMEQLTQKYANLKDFYDYKYDYSWNISEVFDEIFKIRITATGNREKRISSAQEKMLLEMLNAVPKEIYPYIGPYMHTIPGMPEKILNMPGIKETKNKFPQRIAPQLADVPDLEFLSPSLYFILMPEAWPDNNPQREKFYTYKTYPEVAYDKEFYQKIRKLVPPEQFFQSKDEPKKVSRSDFRTLHPTKTSLLTAADVKAFAQSLDDVQAFGQKDNNVLDTFNAGVFLDMYETENGEGIANNNQIKDQVNPCQRLVQKIKILGKNKENQFREIVGKYGFDLDTWAYTCDKTIKAYRVGNINRNVLSSLKAYMSGVYMPEIRAYSPFHQNFQLSTIQGILEMYKAPLSDVLEVKKNRSLLREKFKKMNDMLVSSPIALHY